MSWAKIFAYYALAALLTFHLVSVTREQDAVQEPAANAAGPFLAAVPERIDRVRLEGESMAVQFEKRDGRWVTTEPEGLAPPGDVIDAVLESLTSLPAIEVVADGTQHEDQFGLVPPRMRIRIEQQGELVSTIVLGELSPTRTAVYAKKSGKDEVALIGLNSKYYIDLVFENVRRQLGSAGAVAPKKAPEAAPQGERGERGVPPGTGGVAPAPAVLIPAAPTGAAAPAQDNPAE